MGTQEVVVSGKEDDEGQGSVIGLEAAGWADVEFEGSVEAFDELLECAVSFGFFVQILQSNDGVVLNARQFLGTIFVHEVNSGRIRWVSVGDKSNILFGTGCSDGFGHGNDSWQSFS